MLQNESLEKNKSIQTLHNQICSFEIEIERQKEMLRSNETKIHHLQVRVWLSFCKKKTKNPETISLGIGFHVEDWSSLQT